MSLFKKLFGTKNTTQVLGVSFHRKQLRWAVVEHADDGYFDVSSHGSIEMPTDLWHDTPTDDQLKHIKTSLKQLRVFKNLPVVCVLPQYASYTAYLSIPIEPNQKDIAQTIENYVESYIVEHDILVSNDTVCTYEILHEIEPGSDRVDIYTTLYARSRVHSIETLLHDIGFSGVSFTPLIQGLWALEGQKAQHLIAHIEDEYTGVVLLEGGRIIDQASAPVGGLTAHHVIAKAVDGDHDLAQRVYARYGIKPTHRDPELYRNLVEHFDPLFETINTMISKHAHTGSRMIVAGDALGMPGLTTHLQKTLRREVTPVEPWMRFIPTDYKLPVIHGRDMVRFAGTLGVAVDYFDQQR